MRIGLQAFEIVQDEIRALVTGEAARETNGEDFGIEQSAGSDDAFRPDSFFAPAVARAFVDFVDQAGL